MSQQSFAVLLGQLEDGRLVSDLTEHVAEIVRTLERHAQSFGGKPKASLTVDFAFKLESGVMQVTPTVKAKLPDTPRQFTIFWPTEAGGLRCSNPNQPALPLRDVSAATTVPRDVGVGGSAADEIPQNPVSTS